MRHGSALIPARPLQWRANLSGDLIAALTVTAVAAPEAVSYAGIAGLPAEQGLNTGFLAPLAYAVAGASPQLIVGPTAIMCILTSGAIPATWGGVPVGSGSGTNISDLRVHLAALLALFVAAIQAAIGILRLGGVVSLVSTPVIAGFTTGSALLTASSQFATLLGLTKCKGASGGSCTFIEAIVEIVNDVDAIKWPVAGMSAFCIALLLLVKYGPKVAGLGAPWNRISSLAPLVLVAVAVPLVAAFGGTLEKWGLTPPRTIPSGAPSPELPFGFSSGLDSGTSSDYAGLFTAAIPLALIGYIGAVTIAKTVARQDGPYATDAGQEVWGQVAANAACAIGRGLPITGSFSRTAVNSSSGARTGLAGMMAGVLMALALQTLTGVLSLVPDVARSAIVIIAIAKMVELHLIPVLWRVDRRDCAAFVVTTLVVALVDASTGLIAGTAFSWFCALTRTSGRPTPVAVHAWLEGTRGTVEEAVEDATSRAALAELDAYGASAARTAAGAGWCDVTASYVVTGGKDAEEVDSGPALVSPLLRAEEGASPLLGPSSSSSPAPGLVAVTLHFGPDLLAMASDRLSSVLDEAVAVFKPAALVIDFTACHSMDSAGAQALLAGAADVARTGTALVAACGLSWQCATVLRAAAAAADAMGSGREDNLFAAAVDRASWRAGHVSVFHSRDAAQAAARVVSAAAGKGGASASLSAAEAEAVVMGTAPTRVPVTGVPLSPLVVVRHAARRRRPVQQHEVTDAPPAAAPAAGVGAVLSACRSVVVGSWAEFSSAFDDSRPMFVSAR